jgi:hypothetical protein
MDSDARTGDPEAFILRMPENQAYLRASNVSGGVPGVPSLLDICCHI